MVPGMVPGLRVVIAAGLAAALATVSVVPAQAGCKRMGFLVNDYGKDGPTKDAQDLLDKHIAQWAAEQGIEKYTVGKKEIKCELYLNLIVVDEHTCTASATVCWGGDKPPGPGGQQAKTPKAAPKTAGEKATKAAKAEPAAPGAAGSDAGKASEPKTAAETKPAAAPETTPVETGALPSTSSAPATAPPSEKPAQTEPPKGAAHTAEKPGTGTQDSKHDTALAEKDAVKDAVAAATAAAE